MRLNNIKYIIIPITSKFCKVYEMNNLSIYFVTYKLLETQHYSAYIKRGIYKASTQFPRKDVLPLRYSSGSSTRRKRMRQIYAMVTTHAARPQT